VYAADLRTADRAIPFPYAICDELHRSRLGVYRTWQGKLRKRGAQLVTISTAGELASEFNANRDRIRDQAARGRRARGGTRYYGGGLMHEYMLGRAEDYADARKGGGDQPAVAQHGRGAGGGSRVPTFDVGIRSG
jgi:hypothetical protein